MTAFIFMRTHSAVVVVVWAGCSALCVSMIAYLGAGSPDNAPWLAAGVAGAVLGATGGAAAARWRGQKGGSLLMGLVFGVMLAVGYSLWHGP
jgi:hypothetical protein